MGKLVEYAREHKNIIQLTKLIGNYQMMLTAEETKNKDLIKNIREQFAVDKYLVVEIEKVLKRSHIPLE